MFKSTQMKLLIAVLLFAVALSSVQTVDGVLILNDKNIDEAVKEHDMLLVMFYAPVRIEQLCHV